MFEKIFSYSGNHEIEKVFGMRLPNHKNSVLAGIILLFPVFFFIGTSVYQTIAHQNIAWFEAIGNWPLPLRLIFFYCISILFPVFVFLINLRFFFSIWFNTGSQELKLSFRQNWSSLILAVVGLGIAALFVAHLIADTLAGHS